VINGRPQRQKRSEKAKGAVKEAVKTGVKTVKRWFGFEYRFLYA